MKKIRLAKAVHGHDCSNQKLQMMSLNRSDVIWGSSGPLKPPLRELFQNVYFVKLFMFK